MRYVAPDEPRSSCDENSQTYTPVAWDEWRARSSLRTLRSDEHLSIRYGPTEDRALIRKAVALSGLQSRIAFRNSSNVRLKPYPS